MKRIMLIAIALCILGTSLHLTSGNAHAQTRAALAPQHTATTLEIKMPADGSTYPFWFLWGAGMCVSHGDLSGTEFAGKGAGWAYVITRMTKFGASWPEAAPIAAIYGAVSWLLSFVDKGRGVCVVEVPFLYSWVWAQ